MLRALDQVSPGGLAALRQQPCLPTTPLARRTHRYLLRRPAPQRTTSTRAEKTPEPLLRSRSKTNHLRSRGENLFPTSTSRAALLIRCPEKNVSHRGSSPRSACS